VSESLGIAEDYFSARAASSGLPPREVVKPKAKVDYWSQMPDEIKMATLAYLEPMDIIRCTAVSKAWQKMCMDGQLWMSFDATEFYRRMPAECLTKILSNAGPFVRDLNLRGCVQLQVGCRAAALADACHNVRRINLEGCQADRHSINYLLQQNTQLVRLNLSGLKGVTNSTCRTIAAHCPQLAYVNVNWCYNMDARGVRKIIDGCPQLKDLRVNECRGLVDKEIMNRLFETNRLERLFIHGCSDIRDEHLKVLFEGVNPDTCPLSGRAIVPPRKLRHLDISKIYYLTHRGLQSLVGNVPDLEGLQLGGDIELTDDALTDLLPTVPKLTHLDLEELSELTNETPKNIAASPCHDRLEHVSFSYCENISDTGMLPLIKACRKLKNLEMDNTRVSDLSLAEAADVVRSRSRRSPSQCQPEIGLRMVIYDCQHVTWTGIREVISRNAEVKRPYVAGITAQQSYPTEVIQLKCFYGWQMTVDEHMKRVLKGDLASASRLERKWAEYMMATEEAGAPGAGSRRRRRRAREAAMLHADEEEAGVGQVGIGRRRRARSGGCAVM
jgi:F-box/leucine-rich repeat protein 2/20